MTDNEIIKALECCGNRTDRYCPNCPYYNVLYEDDKTCSEVLMSDALDLIKRQQAEIERLESALFKQEETMQMIAKEKQEYFDKLQIAKSQAIKEFAERLKRESLIDRVYNILQEGEIDKLVKEMTEVETN